MFNKNKKGKDLNVLGKGFEPMGNQVESYKEEGIMGKFKNFFSWKIVGEFWESNEENNIRNIKKAEKSSISIFTQNSVKDLLDKYELTKTKDLNLADLTVDDFEIYNPLAGEIMQEVTTIEKSKIMNIKDFEIEELLQKEKQLEMELTKSDVFYQFVQKKVDNICEFLEKYKQDKNIEIEGVSLEQKFSDIYCSLEWIEEMLSVDFKDRSIMVFLEEVEKDFKEIEKVITSDNLILSFLKDKYLEIKNNPMLRAIVFEYKLLDSMSNIINDLEKEDLSVSEVIELDILFNVNISEKKKKLDAFILKNKDYQVTKVTKEINEKMDIIKNLLDSQKKIVKKAA